MNDKNKGMIFGAFIGDAHALGAHWVYDTGVIDREAGRITDLIDPIAVNFHPHRSAGEFTHYGDQMLLFLEYMSAAERFESRAYLQMWKKFYDSYDGYKDHAMEETRRNLEAEDLNSGSHSTDLAGAFYAPILAAFNENSRAGLLSDVEKAVRMTHDSADVVQAAGFFAEVMTEAAGGTKPSTAIVKVLKSGSFSDEFRALVEKGIDSTGEKTRETIAAFGQACPADYGTPGVIHLICSYEGNIEEGLVENVMAGGDSAARGILTGAVLGAYEGFESIPERWRKVLAAKDKIEKLCGSR
jgi:ADP-ribosylglycohydrolase